MFGLFKKKDRKNNVTFDYSTLMVDMHSHVLPGIDDGAQTPEESIALAWSSTHNQSRTFSPLPYTGTGFFCLMLFIASGISFSGK